MLTVRDQLLNLFPSKRKSLDSEKQAADALESLLNTSDIGVTLDGWQFIRIVRESHDVMEAVGLMWLLPGGSIPIAVNVNASEAGLTWVVQMGRDDEAWRGLSDSKKWNSVYLYASGNRAEPEWTWDQTRQGKVRAQPTAG